MATDPNAPKANPATAAATTPEVLSGANRPHDGRSWATTGPPSWGRDAGWLACADSGESDAAPVAGPAPVAGLAATRERSSSSRRSRSARRG